MTGRMGDDQCQNGGCDLEGVVSRIGGITQVGRIYSLKIGDIHLKTGYNLSGEGVHSSCREGVLFKSRGGVAT